MSTVLPANPAPQTQPEAGEPMSPGERWFLGSYIAVVALLLIYVFAKLWPAGATGGGAASAQATEELLFGLMTVKTSAEVRLFVLVLCAGALGAMLHAVQSFVDFHGNRQLVRSWLPWYLLRPLNGALLALVFYLLIQGGLISDPMKGSEAVRLYIVAGVAALIGMFSELATIKLKDVFTALLANPVKPRSDPLQPSLPKPEITAIQPTQLAVSVANPRIKILGKNFDKMAKVLADNAERSVLNATTTELTVQLDVADVATKRVLKIVVENPAAAGGRSDAQDLPVV